MSDIQLSIFGSWARPHDWGNAFKNLSDAAQRVSYEIVVAGPVQPTFELPQNVRFIHLLPDKGSSTCCQTAANNCVGETLMMMGDDCRMYPHSLDHMYETYKRQNDYRCMVHPRWGTGPENDVTDAHPYLFESPDPDLRYGFPLRSKRFFDEVGGFDKRFTFGPHDAEWQIRAYRQGGWYVYDYNAFFYEDLTAQGNTFGGTHYIKKGYEEFHNLILKRWYSNGEQYGGTLLKEPRTPFEPIGE